MPQFGGMTPFPLRFGGGRPRVQDILDNLNADMGDAYNASDRETAIYVENIAIARAISAAWGTNERLGNLWVPKAMPSDLVARWEKILALSPLPSLSPLLTGNDAFVFEAHTQSEADRRERLALVFGLEAGAILGYIIFRLEEELGDAFYALEHIPYDFARISSPDATYPWGQQTEVPWASSTAHILIRLVKPASWSEREFIEVTAQVQSTLEPLLPAWVTFEWYRGGANSVAIPQGPSAAGFYLDEDNNLDNQIFMDDLVMGSIAGSSTASGAVSGEGYMLGASAGTSTATASGSVGFDPSGLSLTGWWRDMAASFPHAGTASAGSSGSNNITSSGNNPSAGTALNGHGTFDYDGSANYSTTTGTLDTYVANNQGSGWVLFKIDALDTNGDFLFSDVASGQTHRYLVQMNGTGDVTFTIINSLGNSFSATASGITAGNWCLVQWKHTGAGNTVNIRVNGGSWSSTATGGATVHFLTNLVYLAGSNNIFPFDGCFNGLIAEVGLSDSVISDTNFNNIKDYINERYGLSL